MAKKLLFLKTAPVEHLWEEIEYTPPKHAVDIGNFNEFFASGSYSLPESQPNDSFRESISGGSPKEFLFASEGEPLPLDKLNFSKHDLHEADQISLAGSFKRGAHTVTTASPESTSSVKAGNLSKRSPKKSDWITLQIPKSETLAKKSRETSSEKDVFVNSLFGVDFSNERILVLYFRVIDKAEPIQYQEWLMLTEQDRLILYTYLAQAFGQKLAKKPDLETPTPVNDLLSIKPKEKRNEEKLNKTVKKVNSIIGRTFAELNGIDPTSETLPKVLQSAYFGDFSQDTEVFGHNTRFSQKTFGEAVKNARYTEDFEAVLKKSYISEMIKSRKHKVLKEIKGLRKLLQEGRDPMSQVENNKHTPWLLEDIVDGVKLCQNIIDSRKIT